ncbi:AfsR/SARP family transcriptional regulator [Streptomyces cinnamoneus]|uniref:AfsR/SARP family transcriptional regulator n=1 Tax=Streptomyces cinnamoneus TaxID=53446 RepID=UPI0015E3A7A0|nr:BTAD domain-containing putative transcriptional regulator [Streptomyces cinnamoneus]
MPGDEVDQRLRFHVLGPVRGERDGRPLALGPPQQRAALAVLLLRRGRPVTAHDLVDALWGAAPPAHATATLRSYVSRLRAVLEPDADRRASVLTDTADGYALRTPAAALDATVFEEHLAAAASARSAGDVAGAYERLGAGLALWGGTPLAALPGPYAERERERLTELGVTAREDLFECALALGRTADAVAGLRSLAALHPLRERAHAVLMLALRSAGRPAEALAVFAAVRQRLAEETGAVPGPELTRAHEQVLAGGPGGPPVPPATAVGPSPAGPDLLPAQTLRFTGREALAARVGEALTAGGGTPVVVLTGAAGAGKTALAVHAARAVRAAFPGGLFFLGLRGTDAEPLGTGAALALLLRALGVTDGALPEGDGRRAARCRALLADRRALLVLDDARDAEQVLPLLPGAPGCAVLVTGREGVGGLPGAREVEVPALEEAEALRLLTAVAGDAGAGAGEKAARAVVAACGRLPLAVRVAATQPGARTSWTLDDLAGRLRAERDHLTELHAGGAPAEAAFRVAYDALAAAPARALRLLALPDVSALDEESTAALLGGPDTAPGPAALLGELAGAGLLQPLGRGRYGRHDLLRDFGRRQSERTDSPPVRDAALLRLLDHQLATAVTALRRVRPDSAVPRHLHHRLTTTGRPLPDTDAARAWLHGAHPDVVATLRQVLRLDTPDCVRPAVDLLVVWARLTDGTALRGELDGPAGRALDRARQHGEEASAARALWLLGAPRLGPDTYERAERDLRAALRLAEAAGDEPAATLAGRELGIVLEALGRAGDALPLLVAAEERLRAEGAVTDALEARADTAVALAALGRHDQALTAAGEATEGARRAGHGPALAHVLHQAGRVFLRAGRSATAVERLREALSLEPAPRREALLLARLAHCRLEQLRHRDALTAADRALAIEGGLGDDHCRGVALAARGRALLGLGEPRVALGCLREARDVLDRRGAVEAGEVTRLLAEEFPADRGA